MVESETTQVEVEVEMTPAEVEAETKPHATGSAWKSQVGSVWKSQTGSSIIGCQPGNNPPRG